MTQLLPSSVTAPCHHAKTPPEPITPCRRQLLPLRLFRFEPRLALPVISRWAWRNLSHGSKPAVHSSLQRNCSEKDFERLTVGVHASCLYRSQEDWQSCPETKAPPVLSWKEPSKSSIWSTPSHLEAMGVSPSSHTLSGSFYAWFSFTLDLWGRCMFYGGSGWGHSRF